MIPRFRKAVKYTAATNVIFDGNSLFQTGAPFTPELVMALPPFAGSGVTYANVAVASQTWRVMNGLDGGSTTDVDGAFDASKQNVLVLWEHTNAICNAGRSVAQTFSDMVAYIAARRVVNPAVRILVIGAIPRQGFSGSANYSTVMQVNVALQQIDEMVRDARRTLDIGFVSLRQPGSPFALTGFAESDFSGSGALWSEGTGARVHLSASGQAIVAPLIATAMQRLTY